MALSYFFLLQYVERLKPNYNNVDLSEVEIVDSEVYPRDNNSLLLDVSCYQTMTCNL
jgi:hypothetical protein